MGCFSSKQQNTNFIYSTIELKRLLARYCEIYNDPIVCNVLDVAPYSSNYNIDYRFCSHCRGAHPVATHITNKLRISDRRLRHHIGIQNPSAQCKIELTKYQYDQLKKLLNKPLPILHSPSKSCLK